MTSSVVTTILSSREYGSFPLVFSHNLAYNPHEATLLVGELEQMRTIKGRDDFFASAVLATDERRAVLYRHLAQMIAAYAKQETSLDSIGHVANIVYLKKKDHTAVVLLPLDNIFRTREVEAKLTKLDNALNNIGDISAKELWTTGRVEARAGKMLAASGWKVFENADEKIYKK